MKQFTVIRENIEEDYKKVIKMYPRDKDWKTLVTRHKKAIDDFRKKSKPLPDDVEDELLSWAKEYGLIDARPDEVEFISSILDEETVEEGKKIQDIARKHKRELQKAQKSGNLELSKKAEDELSNWASSSGEIRGDDEDEFIEWLDNNLDDLVKGKIKEDVNEAKPPKMKSLSIYGSEISGLKRSNGSKLSTYTAKPVIIKGKLGFKVTDDSGSFETLDLKKFAKMYG
jgi:hypothetical protein